MDHIQTIIIGGGILGIAAARKIQKEHGNVLLIEKEKTILSSTSSRNSEVIHSGIYYPEKSLKREFCLRGKELLYEYLSKREIGFKKCGKLIVANSSDKDITKLEELISNAERAKINFKLYKSSELQKYYPYLNSHAAIDILDTGIFDSHDFAFSMLNDFENSGGLINLYNEIDAIHRCNNYFKISFQSSNYQITCNNLIICAGLGSVQLIADNKLIENLPTQKLCKGDYFSYSGKIKTSKLIYPLPDEYGLGIHLTIDLKNKIKFGPDTEFVNNIDYNVKNEKIPSFVSAIKRYIPSIREDQLSPDYSGIRPKIELNGEILKDFYEIYETFNSCVLYSMLGYESPGLTSCMAVAEHISNKLQ